jgi:hypothetical protein
MRKGLFTIAGLTLALLLFVNTAMAAKPTSDIRPGWGFGDLNHIHTGPPGQSVRPSNNSSIVTNVHTSANTGGNAIIGGSGAIVTGVVSVVTTISNVVNSIFH